MRAVLGNRGGRDVGVVLRGGVVRALGADGVGGADGAGRAGCAVVSARAGVRGLRLRGRDLSGRGFTGGFGGFLLSGRRVGVGRAQLEVTAGRTAAVLPGTDVFSLGDSGAARRVGGRLLGGSGLGVPLRELTLESGGGETHGRAALDVAVFGTRLVGRHGRRRPAGLGSRRRRGRRNRCECGRMNRGGRCGRCKRGGRCRRGRRSRGSWGSRIRRRLRRIARRVLRVPGGRRVVDGELARRLDGGLRVGLVIAGCGPAPADPVPIAVHNSSWCGQAPLNAVPGQSVEGLGVAPGPSLITTSATKAGPSAPPHRSTPSHLAQQRRTHASPRWINRAIVMNELGARRGKVASNTP